MAAFNLTAEINLRGPSNLKKVAGDIKRQLSNIQSDVTLKISDKAAKNIDNVTSSVNVLNDALMRAQTSANGLSSTLSTIGLAGNNVTKNLNSVSQSVMGVSSSATEVSKSVAKASSQMEEFGRQSALAVRRFAAFSVGAGAIYGLSRAITNAYNEFIQFDRELTRLKQTTGDFGGGIDEISSEISRLSTSLGVSSSDLLKVSVTLAQAGLSAAETRGALEALAKTTLSPSFDDITQTTEGAIAALRQFNLGTKDLEASLGSINAVAAAFAVESSDIIAAIQRTGGVFASASKGVSEGKDALNEFIAVFTSVRQTTRESAETIATGLRTIFTRIQRGSTIEALREYGIELTNLNGKFVGPYEAVRRLSEGLGQLDTRDIRFSKIVEELGGFRQIGKVIPLIQQFAVAQEALGVAQQGQASLTTNAIQAQQALAVQFTKTREEFLALVRSFGESDTFKNIIGLGLTLTRTLIQIAGAFKPILPYLAIIGGLKGGSALTQYVSGFIGGIGKNEKKNQSTDIMSSLFGSTKERTSADSSVTNRLESLLSDNSSALNNVTAALNTLNRTMSIQGKQTLNSGGKVLAFARGGYVPGSGNRDTVPAMLQPGEFVIRKKAVETLGAGNLQKMNKYASGGSVKRFAGGGGVKMVSASVPNSPMTLSDVDEANIGNSAKGAIKGFMFERDFSRAYGTQVGGVDRFPDVTEPNVARQVVNDPNVVGLELKYADTPDNVKRYKQGLSSSGFTTDQIPMVIRANAGGLIQKFTNGGVASLARTQGKSIEEVILEQISALGGPSGVKQILGYPNGDRTLNSLLQAGNIRAGKNIEKATSFVDRALERKGTKDAAAAQAIEEATHFGLVGLLPFNYSKQFGPEDIAGRSTYIVARGTQEKYRDIIESMQQELSGVSTKYAEQMQMRNIFSSEPLVFDFDETLIDRTKDIMRLPDGSINIAGFNDLNLVQEDLQNAILTPLGKELKNRLDSGMLSQDNLRIVTARPQSNAPFIASTLSRLGINIPENRITGTSGAENKINNVGQLETLVDDRLATVEQFKKSGRKAIPYAPIRSDIAGAATAAGQANIEGALIETILARLGAPLRQDAEPTRPIDYPDGLGIAADYFGIDPNIPTEVKRTIDGSSLARTRAEIERYYNEGSQRFKNGGSVKAQEYLEKYKQLIASILPKEMISDQGLLKTPSGRSEPIEIIPPEDLGEKSKRSMMDILLGRAPSMPQQSGGASYSGGLVYKIIRENLYDAKNNISQQEFDTLKRFVDQNLLFEGEEDVINLRNQKRRGSLAHESFHDIQGYLLDYYPDVYKKLQQSVNDQRKNIEDWYSDPSTKQWRTDRDYKFNQIFPEQASDSPYKRGMPSIVSAMSKANKGQPFAEAAMDIVSKTQMDLGRAEAIPVLLAAAAEGNGSAQQILSSIFASAGLNKDFYKYMPKFAAGGMADDPFDEVHGYGELTGGLAGLIGGLYGEPGSVARQFQGAGINQGINPRHIGAAGPAGLQQSAQREKVFGKIGLRDDGQSLMATYFKNDQRQGSASAYKLRDYLYYVGLSSATSGYGPRLYDVLMEAATAKGAMLTSDRSSVSGDAKRVWEYYFKNRGDVRKTPLKPEDWTKNQAMIDPKLYGKPETWPPPTDDAWILQTGYSKSPSLINDPTAVVKMDENKQVQSSAQMALQYFSSRQKFAKGGSAQDTVPALLTPGEFVINKKAAQKIGYGQLNKLNKADKLYGYNKGGVVGFANGGKAGPGDYAAKVEGFIEELVRLTKVIEKTSYEAERASGNSIAESKKFADVMAQTGAIDWGRQKTYDNPLESRAIADAVGKVLESYVTKLSPFVEGGPRQTGYTLNRDAVTPIKNPNPPVDIIGKRTTTGSLDPNDISTQVKVLEKFTAEAAASGKTLSQLTQEIRQFQLTAAISYKQLVAQRQQRASAAIQTALDTKVSGQITPESMDRISTEINDLFTALKGKVSPEKIQETINKVFEDINKGLDFDTIKKNNAELGAVLENTVTNAQALDYALEIVTKRFGTLTSEMGVSETLLSGVESGRWSGRSLGDIEKLQANSNPFWEKLGGNRFPGFDMINKKSPELAQKLGMITEKFGGFLGLLGTGSIILGDRLPKVYQGLDKLTGSSLALSTTAQGLAKALNQAGADAFGMAKLAQEGGFGSQGTAVAAGTGFVLGGIQGFIEGSIDQLVKNTATKFAQSQQKITGLYEQLATPGLDTKVQEEIRAEILAEIGQASQILGSTLENTEQRWSTTLYNLSDAALTAANTFLTVTATLALIKTAGLFGNKGGYVGYYSKGDLVKGDMFKPKGTDTVPAMLTPGEFVVNAKSTRKNRGLLEDINSGRYMARGGVVYAAKGGMFGDWTRIQSDKEAGRSGTGYSGTFSDFYNPWDKDFYKSSKDATEAVLKFGGRLSAVTAIVAAAAAAVIALGPAVGGFFTKTLPAAVTGAWSKITSVFAGAKAAKVVGFAAGAKGAAGSAAGSAAGGGFLSGLLGKIGTDIIGAGIASAVVSGITRLFSGSSLGKDQQSNLLQQQQILDRLIENAKRSEVRYMDLDEQRQMFRESRGMNQEDQLRYFAERSPVTAGAQRGALRSAGFDIGEENVDKFISGLDSANQATARNIIDQVKLEQARIAINKKITDAQESAGKTREDAAEAVRKGLEPLEGFKTFSEAQQAAQTDPEVARLLAQAQQQQGKTARAIVLEDFFARTAAKLQAETDLMLLSMRKFSQGVETISSRIGNILSTLPSQVGNLLGGDTPQLKLDRSNLDILKDTANASQESVNKAVATMGTQMGMTPAGVSYFQEQFQIQRVLEQELPRILGTIAAETAQGLAGEESATEKLKKELSTVLGKVVRPDRVDEVTAQVTDAVFAPNRQGEGIQRFTQDATALGTVIKGVTGITDQFKASGEKTITTLEQLAQIGDSLASAFNRVVELTANYNKVSAESSINLRRTLGEEIPIREILGVFEQEIRDLTAGQAGRGTTDPQEIRNRMMMLNAERQRIIETLQSREGTEVRGLVERNINQPQFLEPRLRGYAQQIGFVTKESDRLGRALERLASDTVRSSAILAKIQDLRKIDQAKESNFTDLLKNINNPEYFLEINKVAQSLARVMAGEGNRFDIPDALKGLEMRISQMNPEDAAKERQRFVEEVLKIEPALREFFGPGGIFEGAFRGKNPEIENLTKEYERIVGESLTAINALKLNASAGGEIILNAMRDAANLWYQTIERSVELERQINAESAARAANDAKIRQQESERAITRSSGGIVYASQGQHINFKPKGTDTVPAMLTPGEFVVNKKATQKNLGLLKSINSGYYADGGVVRGGLPTESKFWNYDPKNQSHINYLKWKYSKDKVRQGLFMRVPPGMTYKGPSKNEFLQNWNYDPNNPQHMAWLEEERKRQSSNFSDMTLRSPPSGVESKNKKAFQQFAVGGLIYRAGGSKKPEDMDPPISYPYIPPHPSSIMSPQAHDPNFRFPRIDEVPTPMREKTAREIKAAKTLNSLFDSKLWGEYFEEEFNGIFTPPDPKVEKRRRDKLLRAGAGWQKGQFASKIGQEVGDLMGEVFGAPVGVVTETAFGLTDPAFMAASIGTAGLGTGAAAMVEGGVFSTAGGIAYSQGDYEAAKEAAIMAAFTMGTHFAIRGAEKVMSNVATSEAISQQALRREAVSGKIASIGDEIARLEGLEQANGQLWPGQKLKLTRLKTQISELKAIEFNDADIATAASTYAQQYRNKPGVGVQGSPSNWADMPGATPRRTQGIGFGASGELQGLGDPRRVGPGHMGEGVYVMPTLKKSELEQAASEAIGYGIQGYRSTGEARLVTMYSADPIRPEQVIDLFDNSGSSPAFQSIATEFSKMAGYTASPGETLREVLNNSIIAARNSGIEDSTLARSLDNLYKKYDIQMITGANKYLEGPGATGIGANYVGEAPLSVSSDSLWKLSLPSIQAHIDHAKKEAADKISKIVGEQFARPREEHATHKSFGGLIYASNGSYINFKPKGTDTVPAMLTPGEFVVNRKATQNNLPLLQNINSGYYNKGGRVSYLQDGGNVGNMSTNNGVSSISIDTSSLDSAFKAFGDHVGSMKQSLDNFGSAINGLAGLSNIGESANRLSVAAASIRNASDGFGNNIRLLNSTLLSLEQSINDIPRSISLQVTGAIPVNVNVNVNGGEGLDTSLEPFKDKIYSEISTAISDATQGNIKINLRTTKR